MDSNQLRRTFLDFFSERGHVVRESAPLIPTDPTLLLINAGMVPFKPYFLGEEEPPFRRATSIQKSVRTVDIDIIGTTARHFSFFEMMGNFSFGDYFKAEAMAWATELLTEHYGLDFDRLWFTAYEHDDEAAELWIDHVGAPPERVQRGGKDNFWQMGVPGPCGPSGEIFYDRGPEYGPDGGPIGGGEDRFVEIWNLVFMESIQDEPYQVVAELPSKNIDTGMGLERLAMVMQGAASAFETDTVWPVLEAGAAATGARYGHDPETDVSLRILADHGRAMTFLIGDGVVPSNDGRGYVLRRLIRRAIRHAWRLGSSELVTPRLVDATVSVMGEWYTELGDSHQFITEVVEREERSFRRTLESGTELLEAELGKLGEGEPLAGRTAFKLHDTYGFPIELTTEIVGERGLEVDREGFEEAMEEQRARARQAWKGGDAAAAGEVYRRLLDDIGPTDFIGYDHDLGRGRILALVADGEQLERAERGREVEVFCDRTPFYAEAGGQVGDTGRITTETGTLAVTDTQHAIQGFHGHRAKVVEGFVQVGQEADLQIDAPRRERIRRGHTGTHVLHHALRAVLGDHATQAGSLVEADRLRFDFSHFAALDPTEVDAVEQLANQRMISDAPVDTLITSKEEAQEMGALAFFGEKYGDVVRVVKIGDFSVEFCGGTHTHASGEVGPLLVVSESSIGSNIRRVEALTGEAAYRHLTDLRRALDSAGKLLRTPPTEVPQRVESLMGRLEEMEDELEAMRARQRAALAAELAGGAEEVGDARMVVAEVPDTAPDRLRQLALEVRQRLGRGVVLLGSSPGGKGALVAAVTKDLTGEGISAGELVAGPAKELGGGGSPDPELSQAGGPQGSQLDAALEQGRQAIGRALTER